MIRVDGIGIVDLYTALTAVLKVHQCLTPYTLSRVLVRLQPQP